MRSRTLGRSGLVVSEIGLDLHPLLDRPDDEVVDLVLRARDLDIGFFATAWSDGHPSEPGRGERLLGKAVRSFRDQVVLATRVGYEPPPPVPARTPGTLVQNWAVPAIRRAIDEALFRLGEPLDLLQLADPGPDALESDELAGLLDDQVDKGNVRAWGVAFGPVPPGAPRPREHHGDLGQIALTERGVASVQLTYNLLRQDPGRELIAAAGTAGAGIIARQADAPGLLADPYTFLTRDRGQTLRQAALRFALQDPAVATALPAVTDAAGLAEAAGAADLPALTQDDLDQIAELREDAARSERRNA
jgi:aryl-alcohol dehydrogenase-like predicted oxidoreductase